MLYLHYIAQFKYYKLYNIILPDLLYLYKIINIYSLLKMKFYYEDLITLKYWLNT